MVPISTIQRATTITRIKTGDILCDVDEMSLSPLRANLKKRWDLFTVSFDGDRSEEVEDLASSTLKSIGSLHTLINRQVL